MIPTTMTMTTMMTGTLIDVDHQQYAVVATLQSSWRVVLLRRTDSRAFEETLLLTSASPLVVQRGGEA
jgi:hypothetical protein